jgi:hypothetical protein
VSDSNEVLEVPAGFEAAHREWLNQGGSEFRKRFRACSTKEYYCTEYWRLVREARLERDSYKCFRCGRPAEQVHHLHYDFRGEDHLHPDVLVSVCFACHSIVEYGRNAEALVPVIRRRIGSCRGFIEGQKGYSESQNPVKVYSRLLEYRDRLARYEQLYETRTPYSNKPIRAGSDEEKAFMATLQERDVEYHRLALQEVSSWTGTEKEKTARIIPLLEREIEKCREFGKSVVQPTDAGSEPECPF